MSSKKKQIIHVKDLIIKADHVTIEPRERRFDPIFGPRREQKLPVQDNVESTEDDLVEEREEVVEESNEINRPNPLFGDMLRPRSIVERRQRNYDPILGRPLRNEDVEKEESIDESKEDDN